MPFCTGLAKLFTNEKCRSNKFVGKSNYQSPEVIQRKKTKFNAKANDIWCVGVTLFMMLTGTRPWNAAKEDDTTYKWMMNGKIKRLLKAWNRLDYVDDHILDIFQNIFQNEKYRINTSKLCAHPWLNWI